MKVANISADMGTNSWIVINLYDFQDGVIENVEYYDGGTP